LPFSGGTKDQPAGLLDRMTTAINVFHAWKGLFESPRKATWKLENPDEWDICERVMELREYG